MERLDPQTGLTLVTDPVLAVYARTDPRFSRSARDYIYVGPVEVNERGHREYLLWVGIASTIDRDFLAEEPGAPGVLYVELQGAPIEFELDPWQMRVPGSLARSLYNPTVRPAELFAARLTLDQLSLIVEGQPARIRIAEGDGSTTEYGLWDGAAHWPIFLSYARAHEER